MIIHKLNLGGISITHMFTLPEKVRGCLPGLMVITRSRFGLDVNGFGEQARSFRTSGKSMAKAHVSAGSCDSLKRSSWSHDLTVRDPL